VIVYRLGHQHGDHGSQGLSLAIEVVAGNGVQLWLGCPRLQQLKYKNTNKMIISQAHFQLDHLINNDLLKSEWSL